MTEGTRQIVIGVCLIALGLLVIPLRRRAKRPPPAYELIEEGPGRTRFVMLRPGQYNAKVEALKRYGWLICLVMGTLALISGLTRSA